MTQFRALVLSLLLTLTACGFQPIYGTVGADDTPVAAALNQVTIANIPDRQGQILRNRLIDRFYHQGRPTDPTHTLSVTISSSEIDLGIQKDATASRRQLNLVATYSLTDKQGKEVQSGIVRSIVSYNKLEAQYGTLASRSNAQDRALQEVAEQITNRVSLYFAEARS
jgi:LPS-assembly lipoprotein